MADLADLNTVLTTCGIAEAATRTNLINNEGFTSIADLGVMEGDTDVTEMAKRLATRTQGEGRINLGTVVIKRLQALVYWVNDRNLRSQDTNAADWTPAAMATAMTEKRIRKEAKESKSEPKVKDLGKFEPEFFETHEDGFKNLLAQCRGVIGEPLRYIVRDDDEPEEFETEVQRRMYQLPVTGESYEGDNSTVYHKLKEFLYDTAGWAWIESFDTAEDGRGAFQAWCNHYNGEGELSKRTKLAKQMLDTLHYKNEVAFTFETYSSKLQRCFQVLARDPDQAYSSRQEVEKLVEGINTDNGRLQGALAVIENQYARDFSGACAYFSQQVASVYGTAQLEHRRGKKKRGIYAVNNRTGRGGRGRGRFGGRGGRDGGRGGRGGRFGGRGQNHSRTMFNNVDVSDPTRSFTPQEWEQLQRDGHIYIVQQRDRLAGRGGGRLPGRGRDGGRGNGRGDDGRNTSAANTGRGGGNIQGDDYNSNDRDNGERGGRNGRGFGRGAYGNQYHQH